MCCAHPKVRSSTMDVSRCREGKGRRACRVQLSSANHHRGLTFAEPHRHPHLHLHRRFHAKQSLISRSLVAGRSRTQTRLPMRLIIKLPRFCCSVETGKRLSISMAFAVKIGDVERHLILVVGTSLFLNLDQTLLIATTTRTVIRA